MLRVRNGILPLQIFLSKLRLLPYISDANRTIYSIIIGYMPIGLILGEKPIIPIEDLVSTWMLLYWKDGITTKKLSEL